MACEPFLGGAKGHPETMCPSFWVLNHPGTHNVPGIKHPCHYMLDKIHTVYVIKMTEMYQCRDFVFLGRFILGTRGPKKFIRGYIVSDIPSPHPFLPMQCRLKRGMACRSKD